MDTNQLFQDQAKALLVREARKLEKAPYREAAWDQWAAKVTFAVDLHLISHADAAGFYARYALRLREHTPEL